jgi:small subunit ribosomal protein S3Ae
MASQRSVDKWKMKKWFSVYAPAVFNDIVVGEMPANDDKSALGRRVVVSMDVLTKNPAHAYTNVVLKVVDVKGDAAHTKVVSIEQLYSYMRSLVRRYRSVSDSVLPIMTKDNVQIVIKLIAITKGRTTHVKLIGIRKEMNDMASNFLKEHTASEVMSAIIEGKLQAELQSNLDHITGINKVEIRKLEVGG